MSFTKAMIQVRKSEGGYVNDPDDAGGETYCGISRKFFPKWQGWELIDDLKIKYYGKLKTNYKVNISEFIYKIDQFYLKYFWKPLRCDEIKNPILAEHLFDCGINLGKKSAVKFFQETFNSLWSPEIMGNELKVDGLIGPKTIGALNSSNDKNWPNHFVLARITLYFDKCYDKPIKYKYLKGWVLRSLKYIQKPT